MTVAYIFVCFVDTYRRGQFSIDTLLIYFYFIFNCKGLPHLATSVPGVCLDTLKIVVINTHPSDGYSDVYQYPYNDM